MRTFKYTLTVGAGQTVLMDISTDNEKLNERTAFGILVQTKPVIFAETYDLDKGDTKLVVEFDTVDFIVSGNIASGSMVEGHQNEQTA